MYYIRRKEGTCHVICALVELVEGESKLRPPRWKQVKASKYLRSKLSERLLEIPTPVYYLQGAKSMDATASSFYRGQLGQEKQAPVRCNVVNL